MPVSASKLVTLAQLQAQAERVKQELAKYTLARVKLLELILSADVTGNPYYVTFNTLTDVVVSSGIWNKSDGRIEF